MSPLLTARFQVQEPVAVDMVVAKLTNVFEIVWPSVLSATITTMAIKANKKVYSTALAAASSLKNLLSLPMVFTPIPGGGGQSAPLSGGYFKATGLVNWPY
jgi:hypothetical protein